MATIQRYNAATGKYEAVGAGLLLSQDQQTALNSIGTKVGIGSDVWLKEVALGQAFLLTSTPPTYNSTFGTLTSSNIAWPDGTPGVYTVTSLDANGAVLVFTASYVAVITRTVTVTIPRDSDSKVIAPMTVSVA